MAFFLSMNILINVRIYTLAPSIKSDSTETCKNQVGTVSPRPRDHRCREQEHLQRSRSRSPHQGPAPARAKVSHFKGFEESQTSGWGERNGLMSTVPV